jgi:hypothetical protein
MSQPITSAALYFVPDPVGGVPWKWITAAIAILTEAGLPVQEVAIETKSGRLNGAFAFSMSADRIAAEAAGGEVSVVGLYSNRAKSEDLVMDWEGLAYFDAPRGNCFLGLPARVQQSPSRLLQRLFEITKDIVDVPYGIAYQFECSAGADFFAVGILVNVATFDADALAAGDRVARWAHEMEEARRYLNGWFRDVYSANILSQAHVDILTRACLNCSADGVGRLVALDKATWLWEVSDYEVPIAVTLLDRARRLI